MTTFQLVPQSVIAIGAQRLPLARRQFLGFRFQLAASCKDTRPRGVRTGEEYPALKYIRRIFRF